MNSPGDSELAQQALSLHRQWPPIDLHADPLLWAKWTGYDLNTIHRPPLPYSWFAGHWDLPRTAQAHLGGQFFGLVSLPVLDRDLEASCHRQIDLLHAAIAQSGGRLRAVRTAEEANRASSEGAVAAWLGLEGAHCLQGDLDKLRRFVDRGVRYLGLVHFTRNACGMPCHALGLGQQLGLTKFGLEVIEVCEANDVLVDLAHLNRKGFFQACRTAQRPLLVSHTGLSGVNPMWRNIDDDQLRALADTGGVVGIIFCPRYLGGDGVERVVDHILHAVQVAGEDVVALGSDWDGFIRPTRGLEEVSKLPALTEALLRRGVSERVIAKVLRRNVLRLL